MGKLMRWLRRLFSDNPPNDVPREIPSSGHNLVVRIRNEQGPVTFAAAENYVFTSFHITDSQLFDSKEPKDGGKSVSYHYTGSANMNDRYRFNYTTDDPSHIRTGGGGDGTIQNS